jgi:hypothetical protein
VLVAPLLDIVTCVTFRRDRRSADHDVLRAFRAGDADAFGWVLNRVLTTLAERPHRLRGPKVMAVAVPGHRIGDRNVPCTTLIEALAGPLGLLPADPGVLVRIADGPEAKTMGPRDPDREAGLLAWDESRVPAGIRRVLLVDDVVASGATLEAAFRAVPARLRSATRALAVFRSTAG